MTPNPPGWSERVLMRIRGTFTLAAAALAAGSAPLRLEAQDQRGCLLLCTPALTVAPSLTI